MQINSLSPAALDSTSPTTGTTSTSATDSSSAAGGLADPNLFITLLTAQLQAQDPLDPMSPQDMVNQLTEVSSLQQLININQTLTNLSTGSLPAASSQSNPTGSIQ